jgi:uncharacterized protein YbbC (DUF1343 family)
MAVLNGIDVLEKEGMPLLENRRIGIITNHTGLTASLKPTLEVLQKRLKLHVTALFSPEHGLYGTLDERVADGVDERTRLPIYSLYGERRKPAQEQLSQIDVLLYDIQDIGCRFYTYISTMGLAMEACAEANIPIVVLDRINPINGVDVEGCSADPDRLSFTAYHTLPVRHGMSVGELAQMFNTERSIGVTLHVIMCEGWKRTYWMNDTGLYWVNPSPNMRRLQQALLYPGVGLLEGTNLSVGRGTDTPFEVIGAPWINGRKLADTLNTAGIPGLCFTPLQFTPTYSVHKDTLCEGVSIFITDRSKVRAFRLGMELAATLRKLYPREWQAERMLGLLAHRETHRKIMEGTGAADLLRAQESDLRRFKSRRKPFLIYE